jgi:hypothetical protein
MKPAAGDIGNKFEKKTTRLHNNPQNDLNKALPRSPAEVVSLQFGKSLQTAKDDGNLVKMEMMRLK